MEPIKELNQDETEYHKVFRQRKEEILKFVNNLRPDKDLRLLLKQLTALTKLFEGLEALIIQNRHVQRVQNPIVKRCVGVGAEQDAWWRQKHYQNVLLNSKLCNIANNQRALKKGK